MSIVFGCLVEIAYISIGDAMYLTVFKKYLLEFVGEIVREDDDFIYIFVFDYFSVTSNCAEVFEVTFLTKRGEVSCDGNMILMHEGFFEVWFTVIHDEENLFFLEPSMSKAIHTNPTNTDSLENDPYKRKKKGINQNQARNQNSLIRESIREIEKAYHDKETHKNRFYNCENLFDDAREFFYGV